MALPALLSTDDLVKFRTRFCERFLQFGECNFGGKCQYSHNMTWRRRSPQKYLYEPRLCENILSFVGDNGAKRQSLVNCHNGKSCKFAHSREEILYHPLVYKTAMCEDLSCCKYYCPFGHAVEELLPPSESPEYIRRCLIEAGSLEESCDSELLEDDLILCDSELMAMPLDGGGAAVRMRKLSSSTTPGPQVAPPASYRIYLPVPGSPDWNVSDQSAWVSVSPTIRIETVVRATSPVVSAELCRALVSRTDTTGLAARKTAGSTSSLSAGFAGSSSSLLLPSQFCLCKVMQFDFDESSSPYATRLLTELNNISKTDHRNLLGVKRVHVGSMGGGTSSQMLCLAIEQCSTSLYQAIVDGYRSGENGSSVRGLARKLNPHNGTTTVTSIQRIADMISGLQRLHFIGISHLRIHPTNVLIDGEASFKLADFLGKYGILRAASKTGFSFFGDSVKVWLAPELVFSTDEKACDSHESEKACDIYALGLVIFFALTGQHAFGTFHSGERLAAAGQPGVVSTAPLFLNASTAQVLENMQSDYIANQHLLYECPLILDLVLRCLCLDPNDRMEISDLSRHPLFWDLDYTRSFFLSLRFGNDFILDSFADYELIWKHFLPQAAETAESKNGYPDTVAGAARFLIDAWNHASSSCSSSVGPVNSMWLRLLDSFPQILVRLWDASKLSSRHLSSSSSSSFIGFEEGWDGFKRNHLHWMSLRASATTCVSHQFVREYYSLLQLALSKEEREQFQLSFPDESAGLSDAAKLAAASKVVPLSRSSAMSNSNSNTNYKRPPIVRSSPSPSTAAVAGMTFVDPLIVKQMAAASAALSAVYDNPELVTAITKGEVNAVNQLVATATIYSSLLQDAGASF